MSKMFIAFSHNLTESQIASASGMGLELVLLKNVSPETQAKFSNISPYATTEKLIRFAQRIVNLAIASNCTHMLCTGEATVGCLVNLIAASKGIICVQSTTERISTEKVVEEVNADGVKESKVIKTQVFQHVMWRQMFLYDKETGKVDFSFLD